MDSILAHLWDDLKGMFLTMVRNQHVLSFTPISPHSTPVALVNNKPQTQTDHFSAPRRLSLSTSTQCTAASFEKKVACSF